LFFNIPSLQATDRKSNRSCVHTILSILSQNEYYIEHCPTLYSKAVKLLACLWKTSQDYFAVVEIIRKSSEFWQNLTKLLETDFISTGNCSLIESASWILQILAHELYYKSNSNDLLKNELAKLSPSYSNWLNQLANFDFSEDNMSNWMKSTASTLHVNLSGLMNADNKTYNLQLIQKLIILYGDNSVIQAFMDTAKKHNDMVALADAQLQLLSSWKSLVEISIVRQYFQGVHVFELMTELALVLKNEREDRYMTATIEEMSHLMLLMAKSKLKNPLERPEDCLTTLESMNDTLSLHQTKEKISISFVSSIIGTILCFLHCYSVQKEEWKNKNSNVVASIVPNVCHFLLLSPNLQKISLATLQMITVNLSGNNIQDLLQYFHQNNILPYLLHGLGMAIKKDSMMDDTKSGTNGIHSSNIDLVLHLLLSLSQSSAIMAEALVDNGLVEPYVQSERNRNHSIWCMILALTTSILQTLGREDRVITQILEFISIHQNQIFSSLDMMAPESPLYPKVTMGGLEEAEKVTSLFYELTCYCPTWRLISGGLGKHLLSTLLILLQRFVLHLQPTQIGNCVHCITKEEKRITTAYIEKRVYTIWRNTLAIITNLSDATSLLKARDLELESLLANWKPLFTPYLEISPESLPSLGILVGLLNGAFGSLRKLWSLPKESDGLTEKESKPILLAIIEYAVMLLLVHVTFYLSPAGTKYIDRKAPVKIDEELGSELVGFISRFKKEIKSKLQESKAELTMKFFEFAESYLMQLLSK
jgi:hypothetical protein